MEYGDTKLAIMSMVLKVVKTKAVADSITGPTAWQDHIRLPRPKCNKAYEIPCIQVYYQDNRDSLKLKT